MALNAKIGVFIHFGDFGLRQESISFTSWRHATIVMRSRYRTWYLYINLAWTRQYSAKLLNRNCYRLSGVSWALAQISYYKPLSANLRWLSRKLWLIVIVNLPLHQRRIISWRYIFLRVVGVVARLILKCYRCRL